MKKHPASCLLPLVCLALCSPAGAEGLVFGHDHLQFTSTTTTYEMNILTPSGGSGRLKVVKEAIIPDPTQLLRYAVTISVDNNGPHVFSLLTLGIQAVTHDTLIVAAPTGPAGVGFAALAAAPDAQATPGALPPPPPVGQPIDPANGFLVKATGYTTPNPGDPPDRRTVDANKVWFLVFKGKECKLIIEPKPDYVWTTVFGTATSPGTGHGTETPH